MITVSLIRHGITAWNQDKRIQGRTDEPLCAEGRSALAARTLPQAVRDLPWISSPLVRARETAAILSGRPIEEVPIDDRLMEMSWGEWEGQLLGDLRQRYGAAMAANEGRGLHFRPPGGESPHDVQTRAKACLAELARRGADVVAVTHKGVIRVIMADALGWDMTGKPPVKLDWTAVHRFSVAPEGSVGIVELNGNSHG